VNKKFRANLSAKLSVEVQKALRTKDLGLHAGNGFG